MKLLPLSPPVFDPFKRISISHRMDRLLVGSAAPLPSVGRTVRLLHLNNDIIRRSAPSRKRAPPVPADVLAGTYKADSGLVGLGRLSGKGVRLAGSGVRLAGAGPKKRKIMAKKLSAALLNPLVLQGTLSEEQKKIAAARIACAIRKNRNDLPGMARIFEAKMAPFGGRGRTRYIIAKHLKGRGFRKKLGDAYLDLSGKAMGKIDRVLTDGIRYGVKSWEEMRDFGEEEGVDLVVDDMIEYGAKYGPRVAGAILVNKYGQPHSVQRTPAVVS